MKIKAKAPQFSFRSFVIGTTLSTAIIVLVLVSVFAVAMKPRTPSLNTMQVQGAPGPSGRYDGFAKVEHFCDQGVCAI